MFPVVVPAAATKLRAGHGMINVAALHVLTTVTSRGQDAWVGACGSQAKFTTANKVRIRQAEVGGHRDCAKVSPSVLSGACALMQTPRSKWCCPTYTRLLLDYDSRTIYIGQPAQKPSRAWLQRGGNGRPGPCQLQDRHRNQASSYHTVQPSWTCPSHTHELLPM